MTKKVRFSMSYFEVCAKCGHVGRNYYVEKVFAVVAEDGSAAARFTRNIPRVKHHQKDAIIYVNEIDADRFNEICQINDADPYFKCTSIQDQRRLCPEITVLCEHGEECRDRGEITGKRFYDGKKAIRNPKKYYRFAGREERHSA